LADRPPLDTAAPHALGAPHGVLNPPLAVHPLSTLPPQDKAALKSFGVPNDIDFVALSFTRTAEDIQEARAHLESIGMGSAKIIAKIENKVGPGPGLRGPWAGAGVAPGQGRRRPRPGPALQRGGLRAGIGSAKGAKQASARPYL
jgi:hypothetical protein